MTLEARLGEYRCTIQRLTAETDDTPATPDAHLSGVDCYYFETSTDERADSGGIRTVKRSVLMLPSGTDIKAHDRITSLTTADGTELASPPYAVDGPPIYRPTHVTALLNRVGGSV